MALQSSIYTTDGTTRTYPSTKHIATKQHVGVYAQRVLDSVWEVISVEIFTLVNNSIVFDTALGTSIYSQIEVRVADSANELLDSPSNISIVAGNINSINTNATNINAINTNATNISAIQNVSSNSGDINVASFHIANIDTVATNITSVNTTASSIPAINIVNANATNINSVATTIVPNIAEILQADTNAITATTQAGIATAQASIATAQATTATTQAGIATTQASLSSGYATTALNHLNEFKGIYLGSFTTAPSSGMTEGDLYWNSTLKLLYVYNQTALSWIPSVQPSSASKTETNVTITTASQSVSATYTVGLVEVYLNGVRLTSGSDYVATNGTSIEPAIGTMYTWTTGDSMLIVTYALSSSTSYSNAQLDAFFTAKADLASPTFTGVPTSTTAVVGTNTTQIATTAFVKAEASNTIHSATAKTTPVDNDEFVISDSAATYGLKKVTWSNIKATAKAYFDTLYTGGNLLSTTTIASSVTLTQSDSGRLLSVGGLSPITVYLPLAGNVAIGTVFHIKRDGTSTVTIDINGNTSDLLDLSLNLGQTISIVYSHAGIYTTLTSQEYDRKSISAVVTSGTLVEITNTIPSWASRITIMFNGVSTNGPSLVQFQLGTSSGYVTSGYVSFTTYSANTQSSTTGINLYGASAGDARTGVIVLNHYGANRWMSNGSTIPLQSATFVASHSGTIYVGSNPLTSIRITTVNGTDVFDGAGSVSIVYEGGI